MRPGPFNLRWVKSRHLSGPLHAHYFTAFVPFSDCLSAMSHFESPRVRSSWNPQVRRKQRSKEEIILSGSKGSSTGRWWEAHVICCSFHLHFHWELSDVCEYRRLFYSTTNVCGCYLPINRNTHRQSCLPLRKMMVMLMMEMVEEEGGGGVGGGWQDEWDHGVALYCMPCLNCMIIQQHCHLGSFIRPNLQVGAFPNKSFWTRGSFNNSFIPLQHLLNV